MWRWKYSGFLVLVKIPENEYLLETDFSQAMQQQTDPITLQLRLQRGSFLLKGSHKQNSSTTSQLLYFKT